MIWIVPDYEDNFHHFVFWQIFIPTSRLSLSCLNTGELPGGADQKEIMTEKWEGFGPHTLSFLCHRADPENIVCNA